MAISVRNLDFQDAKQAKKDEFYTQLADIELEMVHYRHYFQGKIIYLNCDDPRSSNFFQYFSKNFEALGLKRLIATCYTGGIPEQLPEKKADKAVFINYDGSQMSDENDIDIQYLEGNGDFRSPESIELLKQADIVVTNPPFSLFREFIAQLVEYKKEFIILGNMNAVTYKEVFPLFQENKVWYGPSIRSGDREFAVPDDYPITASGFRIDKNGKKFIRVKGVRWFTNLDYADRHHDLALTSNYLPSNYPKYANFDAIEVGKTSDIPMDYQGLMGVPISFLDKYNPDQFEIVGSSLTLGTPMSKIAAKGTFQPGGPRFYLADGKGFYRRMYDRIIIRNKRLSSAEQAHLQHVI